MSSKLRRLRLLRGLSHTERAMPGLLSLSAVRVMVPLMHGLSISKSRSDSTHLLKGLVDEREAPGEKRLGPSIQFVQQ